MQGLLQDVLYGLRVLRKNPTFTLVAVLTLALGIGANLAIYEVLDAVLFRDLPVRDPERLVAVQLLQNNEPMRVSYPLFREFAAHQTVLDGFFATSDFALPASDGAKGFMASGTYFLTLGVPARTGRISLKRTTVPARRRLTPVGTAWR